MDILKLVGILVSCLFAIMAWFLAIFAIFRRIRTAQTQTQKTTYRLMIIFAPLVFLGIAILFFLSLFITPTILLSFVALVPVGAVAVLVGYKLVPRFRVMLQQSTEKIENQLFEFMMNSPLVPVARIDATIDILAASAWKILVRNPSSRVIRRNETDNLMRWFGRSRGRVTYLLALVRDPRLPKTQRLEALDTLGSIAVDERTNNPGPSKTRASDLLRELACDPKATVYIRLEAGRILLKEGFSGEALGGYWAMFLDPNITDTLTRVWIAEGLRGLGPLARAQALDILTTILADTSLNRNFRIEAGKVLVPLCDNITDAGVVDGFIRKLVRDYPFSPAVHLKIAMILAELSRFHRTNPVKLSMTFDWDGRCTRLLRGVIRHATARTNPLYANHALRLMGSLGDIPNLVAVGRDRDRSYPIRNEAALILDSLKQPNDAALIWLDLANVTNPLVVTPTQRVKVSLSAGQRGYSQETKEILQSVAQDTCVSEPRTCFEAATALRQLGYYEEAIAFVMVLDKNQRENPDLKADIAEAMRWRELP